MYDGLEVGVVQPSVGQLQCCICRQ